MSPLDKFHLEEAILLQPWRRNYINKYNSGVMLHKVSLSTQLTKTLCFTLGSLLLDLPTHREEVLDKQ